VEAVAMGAVAAGADGILIEVHPDPDKAWSDGRQSLNLNDFAHLVEKIRQLAPVVERRVPDFRAEGIGK
jgi:3-deoxy-7-phosphoheptulonate synthase